MNLRDMVKEHKMLLEDLRSVGLGETSLKRLYYLREEIAKHPFEEVLTEVFSCTS